MRVSRVPFGFDLTKDDYRKEFTDNYKGSNTLRIGAEVKPLPNLALRAGYGVADGALRKDESLYYNAPITKRTTCYSAGAGFALGAVTIDLAYQHLNNQQTEYLLYYAIDEMGIFDTASPYYRTDLKRNYFTLSFGYKF
jgi:opacity protein-like surface antigen